MKFWTSNFQANFSNWWRLSRDLPADKSTLVQVTVWCHEATSQWWWYFIHTDVWVTREAGAHLAGPHYWNQCWLSFMLSYGLTLIPAWICNYSLLKCETKLHNHFQTSMAAPLKFGNGQVTLKGCNYISMLGLKLIHVIKRGPRLQCVPTYQ